MKNITVEELHDNTAQIIANVISPNDMDDAVRIDTENGSVVITTLEEWNILVEALQRVLRESK